MKVIHNLKLGVKLPLMLVTVGLAALAIMGLGAYHEARRLLTTEAEDRLERTLESRAATLTDWSERIVDEMQGLAALPTTGRAIREFSASWKRLGTDPSAYLRTLYLTENPHPAGERAKLEDAGDVTDYSILHRRYHPGLVNDLARKGFLDLLFVDGAGRVVYSVTKADEFATDLNSGAYAGTPLAALALAALKHKEERPLASDFLPDAAVSDGPVVIYLAMPVHSGDGKTVGAVVAKIGVDRVSAVLATARGLGETGQGYLVGGDGVMRSNLRLAQSPTILTREAENDAVLAARQGGQGEVSLTGQTGHPALASYRPLRLFDHDYAAVIEQDVSEFSEPAMRLARGLLIKAGWLAALLAGVSWLLARSLAAPLERVGRAVRAIAGGDLAITVQGKDRGDEVGGIARALEELRGELSAAEEVRLNSLIQSTAFEACSASMMMVDRDFRISYTNAAFTKLVEKRLEDFRTVTADIEPGKLVGRSMDVFHRLPEVARRILSDPANLPYHADIVVGEARFGLDVSAIEIPGKGQFGFVVEWRDVTELRMNRALLNALDANQLICEFSTAGKVVRANGNLCACLDTTAEAMVGRDRSGLIEGVGACAGFWDRIGDFQPVLGRFELHRADGGTILVEGSVTPVPDRNNRMLKVVLIGADVTEVEARLRQARETAEQMQHQQRAVVDGLRVGLKRLSEGDLTTTIDQAFAADYEELRADFNRAVLTLAQAIQTVIDNATTIDGEAREISNAAEDLSHRTEQQAATLEQTAAALDELTSSVGSASSGAAEADRVVCEARSSAESSGQIVQQAVAAMGEIDESSTKISRIIGVIDDIAFQTNLLALNAGVEAARAGEAGRGFAVVASEVRALAQRSSEAAREIDALISASTQQVRRGVDLVGETGQALQGILVAVTDIAARVSDLAESSREQASGLAEINLAVNQLDQVTQQNAAMFEQTTAASHALSQGARELNAATSRFRTRDAAGSIEAARAVSGTVRAASPRAAAPAAAPRSASAGSSSRATALAPAPVDESWEEF